MVVPEPQVEKDRNELARHSQDGKSSRGKYLYCRLNSASLVGRILVHAVHLGQRRRCLGPKRTKSK